MSHHYQPSGRVNAARLIVSIGALVPLAAVLASALCLAYLNELYYIILAPALATAPLAAAGGFFARWSHVRSPYAGGLLGAGLGVLLYLGQFYALFVAEAGPVAVLRPDVLPAYTIDVVNAQVISKSFREGEPQPWFNWTMFAFELAICASMGGTPWYVAGWRPYCERCQRWLTTTTTSISTSSARSLAEALAAGSLERLPTMEPLLGGLPQRYGEMELTGCLHGGAGDDGEFYVTVREKVQNGEDKQTRTLANCVAIAADDFVTLYDRCPALQAEPSVA